jgi:hypothetical protein
MRKLLLISAMLLLWAGSSLGQVSYFQNFEATNGSVTGNFTRFTGTSACGGTGGAMRRNLYSGASTGQLISPNTGTSNGLQITLTYDYKVANWSANTIGTTGNWGYFDVQYGSTATGPWTTVQTIDQNNHVVSGNCATKIIQFTPPAGDLFIRFSAVWASGDYYLNFDNISLEQQSNDPPNCANLVSPADATTGIATNATLNWSSGGGAPTAYYLYWGTDNPPTNIVNGTNIGLVTSYNPGTLAYSTTYYWQIVPTNTYGNAVGCPVWSFTTMADPTITSLPYSESFDNAIFAPLGWTNLKTGGAGIGLWDRQTAGSSPSCLPHSGAGMARFNCFNYSLGTTGILVTPPINVGEILISLKFWMYRDPGYSTTADRVNVYMNLQPNVIGAELLETINRSTTLSPVVPSAGWYEYSILFIPSAGSNYIIFEGISVFGNNIFIDDISFVEVPTVPEFSITPASWDFETVEAQGMPVTKDFIIKNEGGGTLSITDISISTVIAAPNEFTLVNPPASIELGLYESTTLTVAFSPNSAGVRTATIDLNSNARIIRKVELTGAGIDLTGLMFSQGVNFNGTAITSTLDPASQIDYEAADNFWSLDREIKSVSFTGLALKFIDGAFVEQVPNPQEPFIIRFYETVEMLIPAELNAAVTGTYYLKLTDSYGDGWAGDWPASGTKYHKVTLFINGVPVLTDITIINGSGPDLHPFNANAGDEISAIFTIDGLYASECYYAVLDPSDNIIAERGIGSSVPGNINPAGSYPLEPDWLNPVSVQSVLANVNPNGAWGNYNLYKFEAELPISLMMEKGWFSAQIDAANGSGTWFLWCTSADGDGLSHQRIPAVPVRNGVSRDSQDPAFVTADKTGSGYTREQRSDDLAFDLIGESTLIPLSNWALYLGIFLIAAFAIFRFRRMI